MVPEVINWEAVRCVSIDGTKIRFMERDVEHEIAFPTVEALNAALRQWAAQSGKAKAFVRNGC